MTCPLCFLDHQASAAAEADTRFAEACAKPENPAVRFMQHYVTDGTHKAKVYYSHGDSVHGVHTVCIFAQDYCGALGSILPDGYEDNTDSQRDYFETGAVLLRPGMPYYHKALARALENESKFKAKQLAKGLVC